MSSSGMAPNSPEENTHDLAFCPVCAGAASSHQKFCVRMAQEPRSPTRSTHSTPVLSSSLRHLRKAQLTLERSLHKKCPEDLLFQPFFHSPPQNFGAMALQNLVQSVDILEPCSRPPMHDLGEIANGRFSQLQQLLPLEITLAPFARDRGHHRRTMFC